MTLTSLLFYLMLAALAAIAATMSYPRSRKSAIFLMLALVFLYAAVDFGKLSHTYWGPGWDFMTNCDAARAYTHGLNPYMQENYQFSKNYFTYQPVLLPVVHAICALTATHDLHHVYTYWPVYWLLMALALVAAARIASARDLAPPFYLMAIGGLGGFAWVARSGNYTEFEVVFLILALAFLMRGLSRAKGRADDLAFAVCFGLFAAVKTVPVIFVPAFFLLPFSLRRRLLLMAIAAGLGLAPLLASEAVYPAYEPLLMSRIASDQALCNPSFFCLAKSAARETGIGMRDLLVYAGLSGILACLILAFFRRTLCAAARTAWVNTLDQDGEGRFRLFVLAVFLLQLASPRLKEYTFALFAVLSAFYLLSRRRYDGVSFALLAISFVPLLVNHPRMVSANVLGGFVQTFCAGLMFAVMFGDFVIGLARTKTSPARSR